MLTINYRRIALKTIATAVFALTLTLLISIIFVPLLGGKLAGAGLIMTIVCPLVSATPLSAIHYHHTERLRVAENEAKAAKEKLKTAYIELQISSRRDYLTETLNRQAFLDKLSAESEDGRSGGLLFIDLDHFKAINDTHGHATGDHALRKLGLTLSRLTNGKGFVGRVGGDEFSIFIENPDPKYISDFAENITSQINSLRIIAPNNTRVHLATSIGISICRPGFNVEEVLLEADEKMYRAKNRGKNLIVA